MIANSKPVVDTLSAAVSVTCDVEGYARALVRSLAKGRGEGVALFIRVNGSDDLVEVRTLEFEVMARCGMASLDVENPS